MPSPHASPLGTQVPVVASNSVPSVQITEPSGTHSPPIATVPVAQPVMSGTHSPVPSSKVVPAPVHPSPNWPARRSAALFIPPTHIGTFSVGSGRICSASNW